MLFTAWDSFAFRFQVVIIPCGITAQMSADERKNLIDRCDALCADLKSAGILAKGDFRDNYSPGWKFNHWELKVGSITPVVSSKKRPTIYQSFQSVVGRHLYLVNGTESIKR